MKVLVFGGYSQIAQCLHKHFKGARYTRCDVREAYSVEEEIRRYKPSVVINCAGVCHPQPLKAARYPTWTEEIRVNLMGSFNIAIASVSAGVKKMVFVASAAGLWGIENRAGYCASKAGIISLGQTLTEEGHCVYVISPTRVDTKMVPQEPGEDMKKRLKPEDVAALIYDCVAGKCEPGNNILIRKSGHKTIREIV